MSDYYELLDIDRNSDAAAIKRAYLKSARKFHPDTNSAPDAEDRFKEISEAYEVLSNLEKRDIYDRFGEEGLKGMGGFSNVDPMDLFSSIFGSSVFGFNRRSSGPPPGDDKELTVNLTFEESVFGVNKEVSYKVYVPCDECEGTALAEGASMDTCPDCRGSGQVGEVRQSFLMGQTMTVSTCRLCAGTGQYLPDPCRKCDGRGRQISKRDLEVMVPGGVSSGSVLRITGSGDVGPRGGSIGDLYVVLAVAESKEYHRSENNLIKDVNISMLQASLGAEIEIETLDGTKTLDIKEGTAFGGIHVLKGLGMTKINSKGRGDLLIRLIVEIPKNLSKKERKLLLELAEMRGEQVNE